MSEFRIPEWGKNLLIAALSVSALYLFTLSPLYLNSPIRGWTARLSPPGESSDSVSVSLTAAARPARMAVNSDAGRYGLQYDSANLAVLFDQTAPLLGEALGAAGVPAPVNERRWRQALGAESIYFDFNGAIPFSALAGWLLEGAENPNLSGDVRRLLLAPGDDGEQLWLFWQDAGDSSVFYASATELGVATHLSPVTSAFTPNGAQFAFEDRALAALSPYTFITDSPGDAAVYSVSAPLAGGGESHLRQALSSLSFDRALVTEYAMGDGMVYRAGEDTLNLDSGGTLSYHGPDGSLYPVVSAGAAPTLAEMIETTRQLTAAVLEPLCGDAEFYLISALQTGEETVVTYGYSLNGAAVWCGNEGWAARFRLTGGALTSFTIVPRCYTATDHATLLLPAVQAAAAMHALDSDGCELMLVYQDVGGETVSAGWVARETA